MSKTRCAYVGPTYFRWLVAYASAYVCVRACVLVCMCVVFPIGNYLQAECSLMGAPVTVRYEAVKLRPHAPGSDAGAAVVIMASLPSMYKCYIRGCLYVNEGELPTAAAKGGCELSP